MTGPVPEVVLRRTGAGDLDRVLEIETAPDTAVWLGESSRHWHAGALEDPDREHLVVVDRGAVGGGVVAGFVVLAAPRGTEYGVELRRIVVAPEHRGRGLGRAALRAAVDRAFAMAGRVWLDVKPGNTRALALYASEGFVREQELPASPGNPDGAVALVILARHRG
ncbi:ribosomal protein S18 acetylase RimI-like enzyme [Pseudonocardia sediminis]|uniref:Ribosomal protein S18 acetylase RimI-like enzyme n=1 Tax=Pseudonocardia sediminis TaxID=1397368 RepID=A0A4Q7UTW0_PSEST|nr:GNAT family N-acetyltransferase [Pseudonocardia sediminis]RZT85367.1 ribosomal protein S18 acetylase RimI-like enzyme [Pseudonocardia sediminis]